jgi:hypothetical protein
LDIFVDVAMEEFFVFRPDGEFVVFGPELDH